jgi:hypothetical protein
MVLWSRYGAPRLAWFAVHAGTPPALFRVMPESRRLDDAESRHRLRGGDPRHSESLFRP